jgi:GxxExxY protein
VAHELERRAFTVQRQIVLPVVYDTVTVDAGYRIDLMVNDVVVVEVKAVTAIGQLHEAQLLTYLRLSKRRLGLIINFNVALLKQGIKRMVL